MSKEHTEDYRRANVGSRSTTWEWKRVRITGAPQAGKDSRSKSVRWRRFARRSPQKPISVTLSYRGGAQGWVLVKARGEANVYPGYVSLLDVLLDINNAH